jgi:hypothetical protein
MSSIRFTRRYLLEQISEKFEPGMADREAEATMKQKVKREHQGATAEMMGRLASDRTRQILSTAPKVQEKLREAAGVVVGKTAMAAGVIGGGLLSAGTWLKETVLHGSPNYNRPNSGGGSDHVTGASNLNREGEKVRVAATKGGDVESGEEEWLDVSFGQAT